MKLLKLTMKNFMPYKGLASIEFPQDPFRNVMVVFGDNMRGKTSILNALRWGFYGRPIGRHSVEIPLQELPNKDAASEGDWTVEVRIEFEANGQSFDLRRRAERRAMVSVPTRPDDFQVEIHLKKDGIPVQGDMVETEINNIAPQQVSRFFLFDGELLQEYETLLIEGSEQGQRIKEAIEQVLGVPALINGRDQIGALLKSARRIQQQDLQRVSGLEQVAQRQVDLTAKQDQIERDVSALAQKLDITRSERAALDDEIEKSQGVYASKAKLDASIETQKQIEGLRELKKAERLDLLSGAWRDLVELKVSVRRNALELERQNLTMQIRQHSEVSVKVWQLKSLLDTRACPTCKQDLGEGKREAIGRELGLLEAELLQFQDSTVALQSVSAKIDALNKIRGSGARDRLERIERELKLHEVNLTRAENEAARLQDELKGYDTAELARKRALRDAKVGEEGRLQADIGGRKRELDKVKSELAVAQKTIEGMTQARSQRSTVKVKICSEIEAVFSSSIERLRDRLRQTVEMRATEAFKEMTTQKAYLGLEINNNYGLSILDANKNKVPVRSAGAEQVVALSLIDGLNRTGRAAGPVVMDTPFGRLDLKHRNNILTYLPKVTSQFVLLVHSGEIRPETDLVTINSRVGATYVIREISSRHSVIERMVA